MELRKNWFTYIYLTIFSVCMGFTLFSGILNIGLDTQYPFLWYGGIIFAMGALWLFANSFSFLLSHLDLHRLEPRNKKLGITIESIFVIAVLVVGAGLRVWVIQNMPIVPASDYKTYYDIATLLSQGNLIKDGVGLCDYISEFPHVIGYPYILSKVFGIFGVSVSVGLYFNMAISLISIFLAYRIARLICGKIGGLLALVLVAFWPSQILYINHLASEPVFTCMLLLSIWLAVYLFKYPFANGKASACLLLNIALGVSLAIGEAIRPMSIILLIAIIICILPAKIKLDEDKASVGLIKRGMSKGWLRVLVILISYLLCSQIISGSIARTIDRELPGGSVSFGYNLLVGFNIDSKGTWNEQDAKLLKDNLLKTDSAGLAHEAARDEAFKRIQKDPLGIANLAMEKYTLLWKNDDYASYWNLLFMEQQNNLIPERKVLINDLVLWNNLYYLLCVFFSTLAGISL
ncbi:MAG: glycosyltransferase family 39 protein, partial [Ruminiclostridium sp.]